MKKCLVLSALFAFLVLSSLPDFAASVTATNDGPFIAVTINVDGTINHTLWVDEVVVFDRSGQEHSTMVPSYALINTLGEKKTWRSSILLDPLPRALVPVEPMSMVMVRFSYNEHSFWVRGDIK